MYGLILENLSQYISKTYGQDKWEEIRRKTRIDQPTFSTHKIYPDNFVQRITTGACEILNVTEKELLFNLGVSFVAFIGQYGYDKVLSVLGRHMRDFLNGLDNLHEYLRFSYPRMKPPSFFCNNETENGLTLHYRTKRKGFLWYTVGQITEVGRHFYKTDVKIDVVSVSTDSDELHFTMRLTFDNCAFVIASEKQQVTRQLADQKDCDGQQIMLMPINANLFLQIFPFSIVFDQQLVIKTVGTCLKVVMTNILNTRLSEEFELVKPKIGYNWHAISGHTNTIFELTSVQPLKRQIKNTSYDSDKLKVNRKRWEDNDNNDDDNNDNDTNNSHECERLKLKGQMLYMEEWKCMVYLAAPNSRDLDSLIHTGLYLNDLSLHDFSRDIVLAGQQQWAELKLALDQELHKSKQLEDLIKKLDNEMKRTDELLYQMIPKRVADRLRQGEAAVNTCQYFPSITVLFSDIVNFTGICSRITPMQVVTMLNSMYSLFDQLTEKHDIYKVETIGDAYMCAGGLSVHDRHSGDSREFADKVCRLALEMIQVVFRLKDPSTGNNLNIRIGVHSGAVVGGVVGIKMPRYCLFGDTVNTASRIESSSEAQMVQISEMTKALLDPDQWDIFERGTIQLKGKGFMKTYWLYGHRRNTRTVDDVNGRKNQDQNDRPLIKSVPDNIIYESAKMCYETTKKSDTTSLSCIEPSTNKKSLTGIRIQLPRNSLSDARTPDMSEAKPKSSSTGLKELKDQRRGVIDESNEILINNRGKNDKIQESASTANYDHENDDVTTADCFCGRRRKKRSERRQANSRNGVKSCAIS